MSKDKAKSLNEMQETLASVLDLAKKNKISIRCTGCGLDIIDTDEIEDIFEGKDKSCIQCNSVLAWDNVKVFEKTLVVN